MKKYTMLFVLILSALSAIAQIPNGDFENWTPATNYDTPNGWDNLNSTTAITGIFTCEKGIPFDSIDGLFLRLISRSIDSVHVMPGIAVSGKLDKVNRKPKTGFAYTQRPAALTGVWEFMAPGDDHGFVAVSLTKWNTSQHKRDTIGYGIQVLEGMEMAWADFSIPITYFNGSSPDSCIIFISASGDTALDGSYLFLDKLSFKGTAKITEPNSQSLNIRIFPNPATSSFWLDATDFNAEINSIEITNLQGRILLLATAISNKMLINSADLLPGIYFVKIKTAHEILVKKLCKQ